MIPRGSAQQGHYGVYGRHQFDELFDIETLNLRAETEFNVFHIGRRIQGPKVHIYPSAMSLKVIGGLD